MEIRRAWAVGAPPNKKTQGRPLGYNLFVRFDWYNRVATSSWTSRQYGTGTGMGVDRLDPTQRALILSATGRTTEDNPTEEMQGTYNAHAYPIA